MLIIYLALIIIYLLLKPGITCSKPKILMRCRPNLSNARMLYLSGGKTTALIAGGKEELKKKLAEVLEEGSTDDDYKMEGEIIQELVDNWRMEEMHWH